MGILDATQPRALAVVTGCRRCHGPRRAWQRHCVPGNPGRGRAAFSFAAVAGVLAVDALAATQLTRHAGHPLISGVAASYGPLFRDQHRHGQVAGGVLSLLAQSSRTCRASWTNLESVQALDERRFHWVAKGPAATTMEWDCEITEDRPGAALAWRTLNGAQVPHAGSVIFEPAPRCAAPSSGSACTTAHSAGVSPPPSRSCLRQDPQARVEEDLRRFKQLLETGEIATTHGQPTGRRSMIGRAARRWRLTSSN